MSQFLKTILKNYSIGQALRAEFEEDIGFLVRGIPGMLGYLTRYLIYKPLFGRIESIPYIYPHVRFVFMKNIYLGKGVLINSFSYIYGKGGIEIGDNVLISPNCSVVSGDHDITRQHNIIDRPSIGENIVIGKGSWIGANCVITPNVNIGEGSVIGAGAVVTKDTEPYSINVGVPAKKVGMRGDTI